MAILLCRNTSTRCASRHLRGSLRLLTWRRAPGASVRSTSIAQHSAARLVCSGVQGMLDGGPVTAPQWNGYITRAPGALPTNVVGLGGDGAAWLQGR
jgi:hypothetical protein